MADTYDSSSMDTITPGTVRNADGDEVPTSNFSFPEHGSDSIPVNLDSFAPRAESVTADDREQAFLYLRQQHGNMVEYVHHLRPAKYQEMQQLLDRISGVESSLDDVRLENRYALLGIIEAQKADGRRIQLMIEEYDRKLDQSRLFIEEELVGLIHNYADEFVGYMKKYRWPLPADCQALQLRSDVVAFILHPPTTINTNNAADPTVALMEEMRKEISDLRDQLRQAQSGGGVEQPQALVAATVKNNEKEYLNADDISREEVKERRHRFVCRYLSQVMLMKLETGYSNINRTVIMYVLLKKSS